jgi:hypothetical protein
LSSLISLNVLALDGFLFFVAAAEGETRGSTR